MLFYFLHMITHSLYTLWPVSCVGGLGWGTTPYIFSSNPMTKLRLTNASSYALGLSLGRITL